MAVIYSKQSLHSHYQVRTAGQTVRLYSNGVLHSQFNPSNAISGAIWDFLLLPGFLLNTPPKNILLLGLGGGTLVHLIRLFFPCAHITCIELDKEHIKIAKTFFKIPRKNVTVIHGDAYVEMKKIKQKFDWIIDDVFQHVNGEPERGCDAHRLVKTYERHLAKHALLSLNVIGKRQLEGIKPLIDEFDHAVQFLHPVYENKIVALFNSGGNKKGFKSKLSEFKALNETRKTCRLNYSLRVMKAAKGQ